MANRQQRERYESSILAAALAVAGVLFLFDKLGLLTRSGVVLTHAVIHAAPAFLIAVAMCLVAAERGVWNGTRSDGESGAGGG